MKVITITCDTNVRPVDELVKAAGRLSCEFAAVSVSEREMEGTRFEVHLAPVGQVRETGVYGEARYGQAVYASEASASVLTQILEVLTDGSFPDVRDHLSEGERRQLRDALILEAHIREGRDVFVTNDKKAFVNHGKREKLEAAFSIRILTSQEFLDACAAAEKILKK
jgi:predicted nucleic acid-binding protein